MRREGRGVAGRAHRTCSCPLHSTCEGDMTGSSCGGSCRWCTGWSPGRCNRFVLLKQRSDDQIRDVADKEAADEHFIKLHTFWNEITVFYFCNDSGDFFFHKTNTAQYVVCVSLWMLLLKNALQPSHDQTP